MGRVTLALEGWAPPALQRAGHDWNPESGAAVLRRLVPGLDAFDQERKSLLLAVASELEAAAPRLRAAPRQVCHADANDDNVLLSPDGASVVGLIDFGDMGSMPRVCEVAIAMLYTMLLADNRSYGRTSTAAAGGTAEQGPEAQEEEAEEATLRRLLGAAGQLLSGYLSLVPLSPPELALLPLLLRGRLAQSLALGAASVEVDPGNAGYLLATQRPGWRLIRLLAPGRVAGEEQLLGWLRGAEGG
ncbi:hypothetical protein HYH03_009426 [Edaphochlamys debaryana]|uniref:Hydroxylysine kinase n=1 Tax=Edaphochlamys debaryana TaxID=47281 RepID=A0A836BXP4_9CHLO|nr:hypothetical protein HYH03_009426 [Edaphochlamys debaryana]|eukprot:KAG2492177.1 hypothetical protein HYH03_009426 [Edaphochlamys debaryana]